MATSSLSARLTILLQVTAIAAMALFAGSSLWITARTIVRGQQGMLERTAVTLAAQLDDELQEEGGDLRDAAKDVVAQEAGSGLRIDVLDAAGRILASTSPAEPRADLQHASAVSRLGATITVSVSPVFRTGAISALTRALLITAVPLLLATLYLSRRLIGRALNPLREMERRAREVSTHEAVRSIGPAFGVAELDALRDSFDRLLVRLDDMIESERRFTSDASHELKTPLTVLSGELERARARTDLPPDLSQSLERAGDQARTMTELVEALLVLRRARDGRITVSGGGEPVNLSDLAKEIVSEAGVRQPARVHDLLAAGPDEVLVLGHPLLLASALRNLVDNAVKFTRPGEPVRILVEAEPDAEPDAEPSDHGPRGPQGGCGFAAVRVDDGGRGVPEGERERVFDPFFRGAEARAGGTRGGAGLGLPLLRQVARAHGGDVDLEKSPLGGARFTLRLPLLCAGKPHTL